MTTTIKVSPASDIAKFPLECDECGRKAVVVIGVGFLCHAHALKLSQKVWDIIERPNPNNRELINPT